SLQWQLSKRPTIRSRPQWPDCATPTFVRALIGPHVGLESAHGLASVLHLAQEQVRRNNAALDLSRGTLNRWWQDRDPLSHLKVAAAAARSLKPAGQFHKLFRQQREDDQSASGRRRPRVRKHRSHL